MLDKACAPSFEHAIAPADSPLWQVSRFYSSPDRLFYSVCTAYPRWDAIYQIIQLTFVRFVYRIAVKPGAPVAEVTLYFTPGIFARKDWSSRFRSNGYFTKVRNRSYANRTK